MRHQDLLLPYVGAASGRSRSGGALEADRAA
jgi:hypothetical protein